MPRKIAVLTTFYEASSGFSLIGVAEQQIRAMHRHGYEPVVIVQDNFRGSGYWSPQQMDLRPILPSIPITDKVEPDFTERVIQIFEALSPTLSECDVVITHDVFYQDFYLAHNHACRRIAAEKKNLLWLNWVHSAPHDPPSNADQFPYVGRYTAPPGYLIYPNHVHAERVARMFRTDPRQVRVVRHAVDPCDVAGANDLTRTLYDRARFEESDVCIVYPTRLDRGKQPEKIVYIAAGIKQAGVPVSFLLIDWQSTGENFQAYLRDLHKLANDLDCSDSFFVSSELDGRCQLGVPRETVLQLFRLADLCILPSKSETYSLIAHEAILSANMLVLNSDLNPMYELYNGFARYFPFSSDSTTTQYWSDRPDGTKVEDEPNYWRDRAKEILAEIRGSRVLFARSVARTQWNPNRIFQREIEPLFYLEAPM